GPAQVFSSLQMAATPGPNSPQDYQPRESAVSVSPCRKQIVIVSMRSSMQRRVVCSRRMTRGQRGQKFPATIAFGDGAGTSTRSVRIQKIRTRSTLGTHRSTNQPMVERVGHLSKEHPVGTTIT